MVVSEGYIYDSAFQNMAAAGSVHAARRIISVIRTILPVQSVVDFGCARGTWLREWQAQAVDEVAGVDGEYVDRSKLEIDPRRFFVRDLARPFNLERRFDIAESLEVAEHLHPTRGAGFVADIVAHASVVLFSAATPGQGGENHVNEQSLGYWQRLFMRHDYVAIDCLRPVIGRDKGIPVWYRHNIVLYVHRLSLQRITPFARHFQIPEEQQIADVSAFPYRVRKSIIRSLPRSFGNCLARWNARRFR